jgi:hypothetical protein
MQNGYRLTNHPIDRPKQSGRLQLVGRKEDLDGLFACQGCPGGAPVLMVGLENKEDAVMTGEGPKVN